MEELQQVAASLRQDILPSFGVVHRAERHPSSDLQPNKAQVCLYLRSGIDDANVTFEEQPQPWSLNDTVDDRNPASPTTYYGDQQYNTTRSQLIGV